MKQLPKGYYAVLSGYSVEQTEQKNAPHDVFTYKGVTYAVTLGENLFFSPREAIEKATDIPDEVLEGLDYESFSTPVLLLAPGVHNIDQRQPPKWQEGSGLYISRSIVMLGEHAGVNPSLPVCGTELPAENPVRTENESILRGTYWWGDMTVKGNGIETIIFDGFTFDNTRFRDYRGDGPENAYISFRNIIEVGPCGRQMFMVEPTRADSKMVREVFLQNIRSVGYDDYGYGGMFARICAPRVTLDGIVFADTKQIFGFSTISHRFSNAPRNADASEYTITNSYFRNLGGEQGISTGARDAGECAVSLTVEGCTFVDASREGESPIQPHLSNEASRLVVKDCSFLSTKSCSVPVISVFGTGRNISVENCEIKGYNGEWQGLPVPPTHAPDYLASLDTDWVTATADPHTVLAAGSADFSAMDALYEGTKAYYGDLHVHTACGGTSDGAFPMKDWPAAMDEKKLDFAAVVDHRQMRGFFLPEWDKERFIIGTEPACLFTGGLKAARHGMHEIHFNMLFPHEYGLAMVLANFPEFKFHGDELTGSFVYPKITMERFHELTAYVQSIGGIMVHPHPKTMLCSDDPMDYYVGEHMFLETLYGSPDSHYTFKNYDLWCELLAMGKRVYSSCGTDTHGNVKNDVVATFYTKEKSGRAFFDQMRTADFTSGAVGMKMCIDGAPMGSEIFYRDGMVLTLRLDDFYSEAFCENNAYELRIITDKGVAYAATYNGKLPQALALQVEKRAFYRAEIFNLTAGCYVAIGNPIWME